MSWEKRWRVVCSASPKTWDHLILSLIYSSYRSSRSIKLFVVFCYSVFGLIYRYIPKARLSNSLIFKIYLPFILLGCRNRKMKTQFRMKEHWYNIVEENSNLTLAWSTAKTQSSRHSPATFMVRMSHIVSYQISPVWCVIYLGMRAPINPSTQYTFMCICFCVIKKFVLDKTWKGVSQTYLLSLGTPNYPKETFY